MEIKKHSGLTLVELCISLTLMSLVMVAGMKLLGITFKGVHDIDNEIRVEREDSTFAALVNENIQKSTVLFTVPKNSFINEKLTDGWNYIGVMENVEIPKACSRTGKKIDEARALVYIEYLGKNKPSSLPRDCNLIHNDHGYFSQKIIGHAFTDSNGNFHDYSIVFKPENSAEDIPSSEMTTQNITYEFVSIVKDKNGNDVGEGKGIDIDTMLHSLNSLNINYRGTEANPAIAIAFKPNFMPVQGIYEKTNHNVNIVLVLNMSEGMGTGRLDEDPNMSVADLAKNEVVNLLSQISSNLKNVNILFVPYSTWGGYGPLYGFDEDDINGQKSIKYLYDLNTDYNELKNNVKKIKVDGRNNGGDGMRTAYFQLEKAKKNGLDFDGNNYLIYVNGSLIDCLSVKKDYMKTHDWDDIYFGKKMIPPHVVNSSSVQYGAEHHNREYLGYWVEKIEDDFDIKKSYFIDLYQESMFGDPDEYRKKDHDYLSEKFDDEWCLQDIEEIKARFKYIGNDIIELVDSIGGPIL